MRQSTSEHTRKTNLRLQERQDAPRRRRGAHRDRPLTQEELLAEAKITAELNIRSLGKNISVIKSCNYRGHKSCIYYGYSMNKKFEYILEQMSSTYLIMYVSQCSLSVWRRDAQIKVNIV